MPGQPSLLSLPRDLVGEIAWHLDQSDKLALAAACRTLHTYSREDDAWWEDGEVHADLSSPAKAASFQAWLARCCPPIVCYVSAWNSAAEPERFNSFLRDSYEEWAAKLARAAVHLRVPERPRPDLCWLDLSWLHLSQQELQAIASHTRLAELHLHSCSLAALPPSFTALTGLLSLDLSNCRSLRGGLGCLRSFTRLATLSLSCCYGLWSLPPETAHCTALQWVDLSNCVGLEGGLEHLGHLPHLHHIDMCTQSNASLPAAFSGLTSLQSLTLSGQQLALPGSLAPIAQLPRPFELLIFAFDRSLAPLPAGFTALARLLLCDAANAVDWVEQLPFLPSLKTLDLVSCRLTAVPHALTKFSALTRLDLQRIATLGRMAATDASWQALAALPSLRALQLTECGLVMLPLALSTVSSLREVHLSGNSQLQPRSLKPLEALPHLNVSGCELCTSLSLPISNHPKVLATLAAL